MKKAIFILLVMMAGANLQGAPKAKARPRAKAIKVAPAQDKDLLDFSLQPFSDQGSHFALTRLKNGGFTAWELNSAAAFGSQAASPHPAKKLFDFRLALEISGKDAALFSKLPQEADTAEYGPRWAMEKASDSSVVAESGMSIPETDALVMAANFTNKSKVTIKVRPKLVLSGGMDNFDTTAFLDPKSGVLSLTLDRSKLVQRKFKEVVCLIAGSGKSSARFTGGAAKNEELSDVPQVSLGVFGIELGPKATTTLKPGQSLRFPVALKVAPEEKQARLPMDRLWKRWALPKGEAISKAKARWLASASHLPHAADPRFERVSRRAAATLLMNSYARRSELKSDMISQAKSYADAFYSDGLPLAALGMSELDHGVAESALLELTSFAAAAPAPIPPYSGEELLPWEAAGLPLQGWAAWELYQRDPELGRAGAFLTGMGVRLRNECAWWPEHRDGDGNGLFAYACEEEKPWGSRQASAASSSATAAVQTYSVALSSFVAWQMQAASALADATGNSKEAQGLLFESQKIALALKKETRDAKGVYAQGFDGYLPYLLGLDTELAPARSAMQALLQQVSEPVPFMEKGMLSPAKAYLMLRTLALYGYTQEARAAAAKILTFLEDKPCYSAYDLKGQGLGYPGDAATAGAILEMTLERYTQDAYFLSDSTRLSGGLLSVRAPDGSFYLKRVGLSPAKAVYSPLSLSVTASGFTLVADKETRISLSSKWNVQVTDLKAKQDIFKGTKRVTMILRSKAVYEFKIENH